MAAQIIFRENQKVDDLLSDYPPPMWLAHKPIALFPYAPFDGIFAEKGETDCMYLSVGLAQYDQDEISAKTFRHSGEKWSRQSEELPLHRVVDLVIWLSMVLFSRSQGKITVPAGTFWKQDNDIAINCPPPGEDFQERMAVLEKFLQDSPDNPDSHRKIIENRLMVLAKILKDLGFLEPTKTGTEVV